MVSRPSSQLMASGLNAVTTPRGYDPTLASSGAGLNRSSAPTAPIGGGRTVEEMEKALQKFSLRTVDQIRSDGPQTARSLFEENKRMAQEKQLRKAQDADDQQALAEQLLAQTRGKDEIEKSKQLHKRDEKARLAQAYKASIVRKEDRQRGSYQEKLESGAASTHFPYVEGETVLRGREAQKELQRSEMQDFVRKQRAGQPPRQDALLTDVSQEHSRGYPDMPTHTSVKRGDLSARASSTPAGDPAPATHSGLDDGVVAPYIGGRHPRMLSRTRVHMSRRIQDGHIKKALDDKVATTKHELEALSQKRREEAYQWEEGLMVSDAMRHDAKTAKDAALRRNQAYVQKQVQDKNQQLKSVVVDRRAAPAGYWGPEEKELQDPELHREHCVDLIKQMEVNQSRRLDDNNRRLRQERRLIDNSLAEMAQDRGREQDKNTRHKAVLTTTWQSQQMIRQAQESIETM